MWRTFVTTHRTLARVASTSPGALRADRAVGCRIFEKRLLKTLFILVQSLKHPWTTRLQFKLNELWKGVVSPSGYQKA